MTATIIPLYAARFRPRHNVTPDEALVMHADHDLATAVFEWAMAKREAAARGMTPGERADLLAVVGRIKGHPEP